jgi:hypothetical protein
MALEELGLLGVGAKPGDDDERDPGPSRGGGHPGVRGRNVRPHPLAVAFFVWPYPARR